MMITRSQAGALVGVSRQAIEQAQLRGELPRIEISGRVFVDKEDVIRWSKRPEFGYRGGKVFSMTPRAIARREKQKAAGS